MAEEKIRPLTEDELLYAVPPDAAKKAQAKVVPLTLSTAGVTTQAKTLSSIVPTVSPHVPVDTATSPAPSFFKENQTLLIVLGVVAALAIGYYIYDHQRRKKEHEESDAKKQD